MSKSPTNLSAAVELRGAALRALLALHQCDPALVHEHAQQLEAFAAMHSAMAPREACGDCDVKRAIGALLHAVAALRELADELEHKPHGSA